MAKREQRWDSMDPGRWMTTPFTKTAEGFLVGRAIVTSVGVFTYVNKDGSVSRELRPPDEVFDSESLNSMKLKPLANDHPAEKITAANAKVYQVGSLGDNPSDWVDSYAALNIIPERGLSGSDGFHVAIDLTVNDAATVQDIEMGKCSLSMGYECELEVAPPGATWCGIAYDGIQRKIRYNHCAIVDRARAGDAARIRLDSADAVQIYQPGTVPETNREVGKMAMKKINLDGVEYEGEEKLIQFYQDQKKRSDTAEKDLEKARADGIEAKTAFSKMEAERDALKERADKAEKELKEAKDQALDPKRLDEALNARIILFDAADRAGVEIKDGMADLEIKKAVISAVSPSAKLDGKDEVYIVARFDAAVESLNSNSDGENRQIIGGSLPGASAGVNRNDAAAARDRMIDRLRAQSRGEKLGG